MTRAEPRSRPLLRILILALAVAAVAASHRQMDASVAVAGSQGFVPQPAHARASTLGFDAVVADFYWLRAVQVLGGATYGIEDKAPLIASLIDVVTTVNPWVGHPYRFAAVWLTQSEEQVRQANRLLERAVAYHPEDWRNRYYLGFNHFFYLEDEERAAEVLEPAVALEGSPRYLGALVARLRSGGAGLDTAAGFLQQLAADTQDEYARAEYLKALDEIETERAARFLDRARAEFERRRGRDIERVEDLLTGPNRVLRRLPPAHPHFEGFGWELDVETSQIVSGFYRSRYQPHIHPMDRARQERWRAERETRQEGI